MERDATTCRRDALHVVYIVGCGRSGSTLLERMLGAIPGFTNGGELIGLFPRVAPEDQRCGCGQPFSTCPFWLSVGARAFRGWERSVVENVAEWQRSVVRQRYVPFLLQPWTAPRTFRERLDEYIAAYRDLYTAIAQESGAGVVVDASKAPAQLLALRRLVGLKISVLNLVRDPRGVAHSWNKTDVNLPHLHDRERSMRTHQPQRTALRWSTFQFEAALLSAMSPRSARVRYEDLVASPRRTLERALTSIGMPAKPNWLEHVDDTAVTLGRSHGIAGSRSRFTAGRIELQLDDEWRSNMPPTARRVVTALTFPQLLRYGYVGRRKPGPGDGRSPGAHCSPT